MHRIFKLSFLMVLFFSTLRADVGSQRMEVTSSYQPQNKDDIYAGADLPYAPESPPTLTPSPYLATAATNGVVLQHNGENNGWSLYVDPANTDHILFSINWDPTNAGGGFNATAKAAAQVRIDVSGNLAFESPLTCQATYIMGRWWNVDIGGNALDGPVNIKFYYDPADSLALEGLADQFQNGGCALSPDENATWFKTAGVPYDPYTMTDAVSTGNGVATSLTPSSYGMEGGISYATFSISSFSGGGFTKGVGGNNQLPIELLFFNAAKSGQSTVLNWATATELNNDRFTVERSINGFDFEEIGQRPGHGTSYERHDYTFTDPSPGAGTNYYRLKQWDINGTSTPSNIVAVTFGSVGSVMAFPNPTVTDFSLDLMAGRDGQVTIEIYDLVGRMVYGEVVDAQEGLNRVDVRSRDWPNGYYQIYVIQPDAEPVAIKLMRTEDGP